MVCANHQISSGCSVKMNETGGSLGPEEGGVERRRGAYGVLVRKVEGKGPLGRLCIHKSIILKWMFMK